MGMFHASESVVLKKTVLKDSDVLITLFTKELGKVRCVAKGARTLTSRRMPHLQTGNIIHVHIRESSSGYYLQTTQLVKALSSLKDDEKNLQSLYRSLLATDELLAEGVCELAVYERLMRFFVDTDSDTYERDITRILGFGTGDIRANMMANQL